MFLYHAVPPVFKGTVLYPLNQLRNQYPDVYEFGVSKYQGREALLTRMISEMGCMWNDVIFLTPVHPHAVILMREKYGCIRTKTGLSSSSREWFEIESDELEEDKLWLFYHRPDWLIASDPKQSEFVPLSTLSSNDIEKLTLIPEVAEWSVYTFKDEALFFSYIPHILYLGTIETSGMTRCKA